MTPASEAAFERLAPQIQRALDRSWGYTLEDIRRGIESGAMQLWDAPASALVTKVIQRPQGLELFFFLAAGDLDEIKALYPIVMEWARLLGCDRAYFVGRRGWERSFLTREEGWTTTDVVFSKEIGS